VTPAATALMGRRTKAAMAARNAMMGRELVFILIFFLVA
jgi:hypothetical protein